MELDTFGVQINQVPRGKQNGMQKLDINGA
jgi:hypothetical protein